MSDFFNRLKSSKGSIFLLKGLIAGLALLIFGNSGEEVSEIGEKKSDTEELTLAEEYISELELRVTELIRHMDGISDVHVIITPDTSYETVYAQNGSYDGGALTEREYVITDVDGDGRPIKIKLVFPKIRGIAVVCRGGSNPVNQEKIVSLLTSLFELPSNRVYVTG